MFETILLQLLKDIVVPEVANFIKKRYEETGTWPSKEEMEARVDHLALSIITNGTNFLNRSPESQ